MNKPKFFTKKVEAPKIPVEHKRLKKALLCAKICTILIGCGFLIYGVISFFTTYGLQSPIILRSPIYNLKTNVTIVKKDKITSATFDLGKVADYIYMKESSRGKNDGCNRLGLYNGYGFRQNTSEWVCYSSREEVHALVINWLQEHIKNGDIKKALCLYNKGIETSECEYTINL